MSVFFFYQGQPAIVCRYVWLAGEDDLRAWGQQVAAQAAYKERYLEFSPEIRTKSHSLIFDLRNGMICNHYEICFMLSSLPPSLSNDRKSCRYQNFASENKMVQSIPSGTVAALACISGWQLLQKILSINMAKAVLKIAGPIRELASMILPRWQRRS